MSDRVYKSDKWHEKNTPKPPVLRYSEGGTPVVAGVVDRDGSRGYGETSIRAACPYCERWHVHGRPADSVGPELGHRTSDCSGVGGYYVYVKSFENHDGE